jgi:hypothetical protein
MLQLIATDVPECERFGNIVRQHAKQREKAATERENVALSCAYNNDSQLAWAAADGLLGLIDKGVSVGQRWRQLQVVEGLLGGCDV